MISGSHYIVVTGQLCRSVPSCRLSRAETHWRCSTSLGLLFLWPTGRARGLSETRGAFTASAETHSLPPLLLRPPSWGAEPDSVGQHPSLHRGTAARPRPWAVGWDPLTERGEEPGTPTQPTTDSTTSWWEQGTRKQSQLSTTNQRTWSTTMKSLSTLIYLPTPYLFWQATLLA